MPIDWKFERLMKETVSYPFGFQPTSESVGMIILFAKPFY